MALIKVVLIDPDIEIHKWFRKHLIEEVSSESHVKYQLTAYTSSSDAVVDVMRYSNADLIIAETHMPGLDPLKAETIVPFLKKYNITIPVIAISSSSEELNKCSDAGVKDFWRKPIHIGRLNYLKGYLGVTEDQSKEKAVIPEEKTCDEGKKSSRRREWTDEMKSQFDRVIQSVGIHVTPTAIMKAMNNPNVHISQVQNRLHTLRSRERRGERKKPHQLEEEQGGASSQTDLSGVDYLPSLSNKENKQQYGSCQPKSPQIVSTAQLISAIGQVYDSASQSLSVLLPKENLNQDDNGFSKEKFLHNIGERKNNLVYTSNGTKLYPLTAGAAKIVRERLDFPKVMQKISVFGSPNESQDYIHSLFQRFPKASDKITNKDCKRMKLAREEMSFKSGNVYRWACRNAVEMLNCQMNVTQPENLETNSSVSGGGISLHTSTPALANEERDVCNSITHQSKSLTNAAIPNTRIVSPLSSDYFQQAVPHAKAEVGDCQKLSSSIYADCHINSLASCTSASEQCQHAIDENESLEVQERHLLDITNDEPKLQTFSANHPKPCNSQAKPEHAFSGALAGVCVSLCLHPVDTIKTVIQSCRAEHRSIFYIGKSIVSDIGLLGLYRGITTNIASSAPISAVYTFSYESVKAALLPYLPKEYHSFAHCVGGGCASIATSFIFTPSDRIKQQMQVRSHYRNCWDALVGVIRNGGFTSLYAGWRAVLCRNVPHSIIKFYTYESLKEVMPPSVQPNTFQTLVCGGLAGSTAALFTTPFDVIKTRLQTQIPGSANQYDSVLHALQKISKGEGVKGLYRGLIPRLIMYMTQGSLFFASYEFFKRAFSLEASHLTDLYVQANDRDAEREN